MSPPESGVVRDRDESPSGPCRVSGQVQPSVNPSSMTRIDGPCPRLTLWAKPGALGNSTIRIACPERKLAGLFIEEANSSKEALPQLPAAHPHPSDGKGQQ